MKAKHRFIILRIIIPNWLSKTTQRISNLVSHILQELRVQILKTYENKPKRPLVTFVSMALKCPISNGMFPSKSASKVILHPKKYFIFIMELYKLDKICRNQQEKVCEAKHKPCTFGIFIPSWLSTIILGLCNMVCYVLRKFRGRIRKIHYGNRWEY